MLRLIVCLLIGSSAWGAKLVLPDMHTTMYYGDRPGSKGVFIIFAGTGGKTEDYGIEKVVANLDGRLKKMGWDTIAFENPLYWDNHLPEAQRAPILTQYGTLEAQVNWMTNAIQFARARNPGLPHWIATRSTSTGALMQVMHEAYQGSERGEVLKGIQGVFAQGLLDPRREAVEKWYKVEKDFLVSVKRADMPVLELDNVIFPAMEWANEGLEGKAKFELPPVFVPMGAMDEVATLKEQLIILDILHKNHPDMKLVGVGMDTHHNPEASVEYTGIDDKPVKVRTMGRLRPLFDAILGETLTPAEDGLRLVQIQALRNYPGICADVLGRFEETPLGF